MKSKIYSYENGLVAVMALVFGCLFFDRLALNFLIPFVVEDIALSDTQIGLLAGVLSLAWAVSSYFSTAWAEANNKKKVVFVAAVFIFSFCSFGTGIAISFTGLLVARLVMGFSEGAVIPLAQNFVEKESSPNRLGLNAGILQGVGSALFGSILAPIILVSIAENLGWRNAFYIAGVPGLILGLLSWFFVKKSTAESLGKRADTSIHLKELLKYNNVKWGIPVACCVFGWWFATLPFISKYFVEAQGMSPDQMGKTMGLLGVSGLLASIIVPALSDRFGRKNIMLIFMVMGVLYPFAVYFLNGTAFHLPAMFITYFMMGCLAMIAAVIPSEAVPPPLRAKTMGLIMGVGEIVGGVIIPAIAGILSDNINPSAFLWVSAAMAFMGILFTIKLKETLGQHKEFPHYLDTPI
ncbi:MFS transporter [Allomuricauda sp. NBRC 101325]|uniref:MFS transporter n=1 Tax=Allomuricauda sp. NBRC 101325 TaxID=1113758 RepID=UPI0024A5984B|nr:MFS transporter [Muricauda sp. NBRC 101325]GLU45190.1 MFS transporter [Muricauda sp. NBRC 101325]